MNSQSSSEDGSFESSPPDMDDLNEQQQQVLRTIGSWFAQNSEVPGFEEISKQLGLSNTRVYTLTSELQDLGFLHRGRRRSLEPTRLAWQALRQEQHDFHSDFHGDIHADFHKLPETGAETVHRDSALGARARTRVHADFEAETASRSDSEHEPEHETETETEPEPVTETGPELVSPPKDPALRPTYKKPSPSIKQRSSGRGPGRPRKSEERARARGRNKSPYKKGQTWGYREKELPLEAYYRRGARGPSGRASAHDFQEFSERSSREHPNGSFEAFDFSASSLPEARSEQVFPLLGRIRAGMKTEAIYDAENLRLRELGRFDHTDFLLRVRGDAMIEKGIHHGDIVMVQAASEAKNGDIVIATLESGDFAMGFFHTRGQEQHLIPANTRMRVIIAPSLDIKGRVVGMIRSYDGGRPLN